MKKRILAAIAVGVFASPHVSHAATAASADDICAPATNPCVISSSWDVTGPLDFGTRTVSITGSGRLHGQVGLSAGQIDVAVGDGGETTIGGTGQHVGLTAVRACSGDTSVRCVAHSQCTGIGTCSAVSSGKITVDGTISSSGGAGASVSITAAGDITLLRRTSSAATGAGNSAGDISIESYQGSVFVDGQLTSSAASGSDYDDGVGTPGEITMRAEIDVTLSAEARAWGPDQGGTVDISAGRDANLNGDIVSAAGLGIYGSGGYVYIDAGRDVKVNDAPGGEPIQEISTDGGGSFYFYGYGSEGGWASGYGGYQYLAAGENVEIGPNANLHSRGGPAASGGRVDLRADGEVSIDGSVYAQGVPPASGADSGAAGGWIYVHGKDGVTLGTGGQLNVASPLGHGGVSISSDGPTSLNGLVDVRGTGSGQYIYAGTGYLDIDGQTDLTIGGKLRGGGSQDYDEDWEIDVCRFHLTTTGLLQNSLGNGNPYAHGMRISIGESMRADAKSKIVTEASAGVQTHIRYRDPDKAPVILGTIAPAPELTVDPSLEGCPVCGNFEIDEGESCDDGNTTSGDGCRSDCQDEGCLAATPGFPVVAMCDDGAECTRDKCNPVTHSCEHPVSCEDGIACTVDSCVANACEHVPNDALCGDRNDCTDDVCTEASGCVYASLSDNTCEDGDFCTPPGTCSFGTCNAGATDYMSLNQIKTKVYEGSGSDKMKSRGEVPIAGFTANPATSGMRVVLHDAADNTIYDAVLPASGWSQSDTLRWSYRADGSHTKATIRGYEKKGIVRISVSLTDGDLDAAVGASWLSLSALFGTDVAMDPCVTARRVPCTTRGTSTKCASE